MRSRAVGVAAAVVFSAMTLAACSSSPAETSSQKKAVAGILSNSAPKTDASQTGGTDSTGTTGSGSGSNSDPNVGATTTTVTAPGTTTTTAVTPNVSHATTTTRPRTTTTARAPGAPNPYPTTTTTSRPPITTTTFCDVDPHTGQCVTAGTNCPASEVGTQAKSDNGGSDYIYCANGEPNGLKITNGPTYPPGYWWI